MPSTYVTDDIAAFLSKFNISVFQDRLGEELKKEKKITDYFYS